MLKTTPAPSSAPCTSFITLGSALQVLDSLVSSGEKLIFRGSCKNPKGRLGVLTVCEESNIPGVARRLQA